MIVYVSGPISGMPDNNRDAFSSIMWELTSRGHYVINPVQKGEELWGLLGREPTKEEYMKEDLKLLLECHAIFMLKGWSASVGACTERMVAEAIGIMILEED
jgi:hypothetical protein